MRAKEFITEMGSVGGTSAGGIATVVGGQGPTITRGASIYGKPKSKKKKEVDEAKARKPRSLLSFEMRTKNVPLIQKDPGVSIEPDPEFSTTYGEIIQFTPGVVEAINKSMILLDMETWRDWKKVVAVLEKHGVVKFKDPNRGVMKLKEIE